jgi:hypothetical protein
LAPLCDESGHARQMSRVIGYALAIGRGFFVGCASSCGVQLTKAYDSGTPLAPLSHLVSGTFSTRRNSQRPEYSSKVQQLRRRVVMLSGLRAARRAPQRSQSRVPGHLAVYIHRHRDLAVAQYLHGHPRVDIKGNEQRCAGLAGNMHRRRRHASGVRARYAPTITATSGEPSVRRSAGAAR